MTNLKMNMEQFNQSRWRAKLNGDWLRERGWRMVQSPLGELGWWSGLTLIAIVSSGASRKLEQMDHLPSRFTDADLPWTCDGQMWERCRAVESEPSS